MKKLILIPLLCIATITNAQFNDYLKKTFKFSTFYAAANGGTSVSDVDVFSVTNGLETSTVKTPYDYLLVYVRLLDLDMRIKHKRFMMVQKNLGVMVLI